MFREFLKRQSHVFHIQLWPDRIKVSELNSYRFIEDAPLVAVEVGETKTIVKEIGAAARSFDAAENVRMLNPLYNEGFVLSDINGAVALINHFLYLLTKALPGKMFAPLIIFQPMQPAEKGLSIEDKDVSKLLSKKCGARNVIIMEPDEYLDLAGGNWSELSRPEYLG